MSYLKGFTSLGESTVTNDVKENLVALLDYGLLEKSGYINISYPTTGIYGGTDSRLRSVSDPRYTDGQVWQAARTNWVWESGVGALTSTNNTYPGVSGVYISSTFYPTSTTGTYAHHINHSLGRVVFNSPISTSSVVNCSYSHKYVHVSIVDGLPWFKQLHKNSERSDNSNFIANSGEWGVLADNRVQLPAIGVELVNNRKVSPFAIGGGKRIHTDLLLHCVAEDSYTRDNMIDIVSSQKENVFDSFDLDQISTANSFPMDENNTPVSGAMRYPDLIDNFLRGPLRLKNSTVQGMQLINTNFYAGIVRLTAETVETTA